MFLWDPKLILGFFGLFQLCYNIFRCLICRVCMSSCTGQAREPQKFLNPIFPMLYHVLCMKKNHMAKKKIFSLFENEGSRPSSICRKQLKSYSRFFMAKKEMNREQASYCRFLVTEEVQEIVLYKVITEVQFRKFN